MNNGIIDKTVYVTLDEAEKELKRSLKRKIKIELTSLELKDLLEKTSLCEIPESFKEKVIGEYKQNRYTLY